MSITIRVPSTLQPLAEGQREVTDSSDTVAAAIESLEQRYPGIGPKLLDDEGKLRRYINLYVNQTDVRFLSGLNSELKDGDELSIVPAVAGG
jgi:molybdopterin synthase sulfur carrier subunit